MKRTFGSVFRRLFGSGTTLTAVEYQLLEHLVSSLPEFLRSIVEAQFEAYNLVQREVDGRALNFYRKKNGEVDISGIPLLEMTTEQAPLVRLTAKIGDDSKPVYVTLTAIKGRVFCMALSRAVRAEGMVSVTELKQAWRSNFRHQKTA